MDTLSIVDLEVRTHIGVPDEERAEEQTVWVSVELQLDTRAAAKDDDVSKTIDYFQVAESLHELGKTERKTIEKFADDIAMMILDAYKPQSVKVLLKKRVLPHCDFTSITITRP